MTKKAEDELSFYVIQDRIAIRPDKYPEKTPGGIAMPDTTRDKNPVEGTVVAVGPGLFNVHLGRRIPVSVALGQRVVFEQFVGNYIEIKKPDGTTEMVKFLREGDIIAIYK